MQDSTRNLGCRQQHLAGPIRLAATLLAVVAGWQAVQAAEPAAVRKTDPSADQKCRPMLNFALPQVGQPAGPAQKRAESDGHARPTLKLSQSIPDSFSFAIGDINLPLSPAGGQGAGANVGAMQAAMKLLAAFDAQLYGDEEDAERAGAAENAIRFKRNRLHLSGLNFTMLNVHLYPDGEPRFAVGVNIANTTLSGQFQYDGYSPASLVGGEYSRLAGHYRMSIDSLLLSVASNLTKVPAGGGGLTLASNQLRLNISNLGYISIEILDAQDATRPTSNYVLKMLQRVLQKTIKRTYNKFEDYIRDTLELEGRRFLDCELTRFSPLLAENQPEAARPAGAAGANSTYLVDLAKIVSAEIASSRLDRIALPDFEYQRGVFGSSADIHFQNGSLDGLDHVRLMGETRVKLLEEHLIVNASVGWLDLRPHYNWTLRFGAPAEGAANANANASLAPAAGQPPRQRPVASGFVAFSIRAVEFDAVISKSVRSQSRMVVDELVIRRLDQPKMDIGGLPGMNRLARGAVNFFMGRLKQRLVSSIQPALKQELERALNRLALFN